MYFKPINFDNADIITQKLKEKFKFLENKNVSSNEDCIIAYDKLKLEIPELEEQLARLGLEVIDCFLFQTKPGQNLTKHIDYDKFESPNVVLNWPIFNCNNTKMNFYRNTEELYMDRMQNYPIYEKKVLPVSPDICELTDSLELTSPHLIDVSTIHDVTDVTKHRLIMSLRFKHNPLSLWNQ